MKQYRLECCLVDLIWIWNHDVSWSSNSLLVLLLSVETSAWEIQVHRYSSNFMKVLTLLPFPQLSARQNQMNLRYVLPRIFYSLALQNKCLEMNYTWHHLMQLKFILAHFQASFPQLQRFFKSSQNALKFYTVMKRTSRYL